MHPCALPVWLQWLAVMGWLLVLLVWGAWSISRLGREV